ncbi:MAG: hypothetical protein JWM93_3869 [Frankiales bacterium]|nr:hypothetical protein [Frankiales bacterium]
MALAVVAALVVAAIVLSLVTRGGGPTGGPDATPTPTPTPTPTVSQTPVSTQSVTKLKAPKPDGVPGLLPGVARKTVAGDYVAKTDGERLENLTVTGTLYVGAGGVTVKNVKAANVALNMLPGGNYLSPVKDGMTLSHVETGGIVNVGGTHITITDSRIGAKQRGTAIQLTNYEHNGVKYPCENVIIANNVVTGLSRIPASSDVHSEAIHLLGVTHVEIAHNELRWVAPDAATRKQVTGVVVSQSSYGVESSDVVVADNDIFGGGFFQVYAGGKDTVVVDNRFNSGPGMTGVLYPLTPTDTFSESGNTLDGAAVTVRNPAG